MPSRLKLRARTWAPLATVRRALTDAAALEVWLAERAEVDLPHTFAFWGRYTPDGDEPHQRPLRADEHTLRFEWRLHGVTTTAEIRLEADGDGTVVALSQSHVPQWTEVVAESSPLAVLGTFWSLAVANLVDHVEGRDHPEVRLHHRDPARARHRRRRPRRGLPLADRTRPVPAVVRRQPGRRAARRRPLGDGRRLR